MAASKRSHGPWFSREETRIGGGFLTYYLPRLKPEGSLLAKVEPVLYTVRGKYGEIKGYKASHWRAVGFNMNSDGSQTVRTITQDGRSVVKGREREGEFKTAAAAKAAVMKALRGDLR